MRDPADRFLFLFTAAMTLFIIAVTVLYNPGTGTLIHLALLAILLAVVVGRLFDAWAALAASLVMTLAVAGLIVWPFGASSWWSDEMLTLILVAAVSAGCGIYVAILSGQSEQAQAAQRDVTTAAQLGVGLVPQALDEQALGRLLTSIEEMAAASCVSVLVPGEGGRLSPLDDGRGNQQPCPDSSRAVADLMRASFASGDAASVAPAPLLTSSSDLYLPVLSGSGFEGVVHADRAAGAGRWGEAQIGILGFAADLLGALIERDRLQAQAAHVQAMEEADTLKANILLSISHDLRTPLAASSATIATLIDNAERHEDEVALEDLQSVAEDLTSLDWRIGELIDLARLEAASWKPNIDWNDASDLCNVVVGSLSERLQARVRCVVAPDTPPFRFDLVQLGRALHHLVENALSYSPPDSEVTITMGYDAKSMRVSVSDHGPGVTPDERDSLFDKFYRGSAGATVPHGTGLGLAIASSIVTAHEGRIEIENLEPTGACFTIVLARRREDSE